MLQSALSMPVTHSERVVCVCCRKDIHVQVTLTQNKTVILLFIFFFCLSHSLIHPKPQTHCHTGHHTNTHTKLAKADMDLCSPQLKKTSSGKRHKFNQRMGTPIVQNDTHTHKSTLSPLTGNGLLTAQCLKRTWECVLVTARYPALSP